MLYRNDLAGYRTLASLRTPDLELRRRSLLQLASLMPATDVLAAAQSSNEDPAFIEGLLGTLASENRILSERANPDQLRAIANGLGTLASMLMHRGKADEALAALAALPELDEQTSDLPGVTCTRLMAWISLDRFSEIDKLHAAPADWIAAIAKCSDRARAKQAAAFLRTRLSLKPEEAAALAKAAE